MPTCNCKASGSMQGDFMWVLRCPTSFGLLLPITIPPFYRAYSYLVCPTRYRTRHFFNNSNINEDIATKFEQKYVRCVRNLGKWKSERGTWRTPSFREDRCLVWDVPAAHNWSRLLRRNHQNSCIYGNLQHICKSNGRWGTFNWIFPAGWSDISHFTRQHGRNSVLFRRRRVRSEY